MLFQIRKDVEMHNLAKTYLAEIIKEECWNSMAVKGRSLKVTNRYNSWCEAPHLTLANETFHWKPRGRKEF